MRPIVAEKGIVKVVHPGRHVEILREPITAAEVMRKNPRHCLTRPDVFKFPWIAVKPDSILPPGKVFWLVPNRTLYGLMKSEDQRVASDRNDRPPAPSPPKDFAGVTPKHQRFHNPSLVRADEAPSCSAMPYWLDPRNTYEQFRRYLESEGESGVSEWKRIDGDHRASISSGRDDSDHVGPALKTCLKRPESGRKLRQYLALEARTEWKANDAGHQRDYSDEFGVALKTCLKKPGSDRKSLGLRVRFGSPLTV